jgi:hypothetical protein
VNEKTGNHGQALFTIVHVKPVNEDTNDKVLFTVLYVKPVNEDTNDKVLFTVLYVKPPVKTIKIVIR